MTQPLDPAKREDAALKPCPFCGPGQSHVSVYMDDCSKCWRVACGRCGSHSGMINARMRGGDSDAARREVIALWNSRPEEERLLAASRFGGYPPPVMEWREDEHTAPPDARAADGEAVDLWFREQCGDLARSKRGEEEAADGGGVK